MSRASTLRFASIASVVLVSVPGAGCSNSSSASGADRSYDGSTPILMDSSADLAESALSSDADAASTTAPPDAPRRPFLRTVFVLLMENKNLVQLRGNAAAPFVNTLLSVGTYAEQYFNPPMLHPSEPNYVWLEAGDSLGILDDSDPVYNSRNTSDHLVDYLEKAGVSWKAYQEDISGTSCPLTPVNQYGPKHNPFVFFQDVIGNNDSASARCVSHIRPLSELASDLTNYTVARYNFITPNLCNDMHSCAVQIGDAWLQEEVSKITASPAYKDGGVLFIAWDEADGGDGPIPLFVVSPIAKPSYSNKIHYDHSSLLKTVQEIFDVGPLLRHAGDPDVMDLSDLFIGFP